MKRIVAFIVLFSCMGTMSFGQSGPNMISKMLDAINSVKTGKYILNKIERIDGKMYTTEMIVKYQSSPLKVYSYSINPDPGAEILFVKGNNNNNVLVHPNKFPYVNLNLSPFGSILRKNQHHTIYEMGFGYIGSILAHNILVKEKEFYTNLSFTGEVDWKGKKYYKLVVDNVNYGFEEYKVQSGETLYEIGKKLFINDYKILCLNKSLSNSDDLKPGQILKVPNTYARKIELYLDKNNYLPVVQVIYDENGLYAQYEFSSLIVNPDFSPEEFTAKYKDYKF
ncbi:MAG: DUF1571 domain-containing protein [Bacteroidota bacterium]